MSSKRLLPYAVWFAIGMLWGTTWGVIRVGLRDLPPLSFAAMRTVLAAIALLRLASLVDGRRRPALPEWRFWALVGVPQIALPYALIFWAEQYISSGLTAMLFATFPAFTAVGAHFLLQDERLTGGKVAGTLLALVAVASLVGPSNGGQPPAMAVAAVLLASLAGAMGAVLVRRHGRTTSTLWLTAIQITSAAVLLTLLAVMAEPGRQLNFTASSVFTVVYLALAVTVGCYLGLFWLLKRLDATFVSMGVIFETTVGVGFGALALGEILGPRVFVGLGLVGVSVYLVTVKRGAATATAP